MQRFFATCGCLFHAAWFALKWVSILLVLAIVWLNVWGLPRPWLDRALDELRQHGIYLRVGQARLDIFHGLAFEEVALYASPDAKTPVLAAAKIGVFLNPRDWQHGEHGIRSVHIQDGLAHLDLGYAHLPGLCVSNIQAHLRIAGTDLRLTEWTCDAADAHWHGRGLVRDALTGPAASRSKLDLPAALAPLRRSEPDWLKPVLDFRQAVQRAETPTVDFDFMVQRGMPASNRVHAVLHGGATEYRGVSFSQWQTEIAMTGALLHAETELRQGEKRLTARGWIDGVPPYRSSANVFCDLPVNQVLGLLPEDWQQAYTNGGVMVGGPATLNVSWGPAPVRNLLEHMEGLCRLKNINAQHVPVPALRVQFSRQGEELTLSRIMADVGNGSQRGQLEGRFTLHLKSQEYSGQAHTTFDPNVLAPVVSPGISNLLALMRFRSLPPVCDVTVTGSLADASVLLVTGRVAAADFTFRDEPVVLAESAFAMHHGVLDLPDAHVVRDDGQARGRVTFNMDDDMVELNVAGSGPPYAAAHMIAPGLERIIRRFEFQGPVRLAINGRVAVGATLRGTDLRVNAEGERLGWRRLLADHASFDLIAVDSRFTFTNVHGVFCGGPFRGVADFSNVEAPTNCRYTTSVAITNADFARICDVLRPAATGGTTTNGAMSGELTGQAQVSGWLDPWQSLEGNGSVYIHRGSIFQFRLFGGLSRILSKIYPGLGYISQTEFQMPFTVGEGRLHSDDISVKGAVISLKGHGDYHFGGDLNYQAQLQLLRSGTLADILRVVTFPVTKLLELKLVGTLDEPHWRPVNLPKELFLQFD